jgi:PiT family inorganic phosphate transporter
VVWGQVWQVLVSLAAALAIGAAAGALAWAGLHAALRHADERAPRLLRGLQGITGLLQGFAYGGNDAQRAMGLFALVGAWESAAGRSALAAGHLPVPAWAVWSALLTFGAGMALGGARVARTIGERLYRLRSADALSVQVAAGLTVVAAAAAGWPVSSTQTATAALLAVGAARRVSLPRWSQAGRLALAWAVTLPLALACGAGLYALEAAR